MNWVILIFQILPSVLQAIIAIEHAFGKTLPGPAKKELIMNAAVAGNLPSEYHVALSLLVDLEVKTLNAGNALESA